jgi:hypothetical protein
MTTLAPFRLSIALSGSTESAGPALPDGHVILDFSGNGNSGLGRGGLDSDRESGNFNQIWTGLADFEEWRQKQHKMYSIELLPAKTLRGVNYLWKRVYKCGREGTGGEKHYQKKNPDQFRKLGSKRTGCTCQVIVKAYPGTDTLLGKYIEDHDHPLGIDNLIYTRVSENAKEKIKELWELGVQPRRIVCNCHFHLWHGLICQQLKSIRSMATDTDRDKYIQMDDINRVARALDRQKIRLDPKDEASIRKWIDILRLEGTNVFYKDKLDRAPLGSGLSEDVFCLVFQTRFQSEMFQRLGNALLCIDATHNTTCYSGLPLFTIMARDHWGHGKRNAIFIRSQFNFRSVRGSGSLDAVIQFPK